MRQQPLPAEAICPLHKGQSNAQQHNQQMKTEGVEETVGSMPGGRCAHSHFVGGFSGLCLTRWSLARGIDRGGGDHANLFPFMRLSTHSAEKNGLPSTPFVQGQVRGAGEKTT